MNLDDKRCLTRLGHVMIVGIAIVGATAHAALDVLERPALSRTNERALTSVVLAVEKAGTRLNAVGERGLVLYSDDEGTHWHQASVPVSVTLTSVAFSDVQTSWAVGHSGVVLRSDDGGRTWAKVLDGKQAAALVAESAQAAGTDPQLAAEAARLVADGPDKPFLGIHFIDKAHGFLVGAYGLLFATSDGGRTWRPRLDRIDNPKGLHLYSILATDEAIWLAGEQGALFVSRDRGASFRSVATPYQGTYFGMVSAGRNVVVFGMRGNAYWSGDQGSTWEKCLVQTNGALTAGLRTKSGAVMLTDDSGNVFVSRDEGRRFERSPLPKQTPLNAILEVSPGRFVLAGARGLGLAGFSQPAVGSEP
ncbi:WD40/YVTN/BNR-like repeat-containing protein [Thauera sp. SDU_THAU2]|uniref:WD40/YVTN/BNR-like repeat-containing protein n=1 Tax=Thauera sp. SDU_THAU2 TaxID=3136633 RepID=UPI00311F5C73